jgi:pimeloyl-ACP methyl ester carboxylesterase
MASLQTSPVGSAKWQQRIATITTESQEELRINYLDSSPEDATTKKGTILLIHGFPETSYQFRHVITPLSQAGYRVIAPDYRGAGQSSKPLIGYTKTQMAEDLHILIQLHLSIKDKVHIVGHDIGGMIAFTYASRYASDVASVIWGECPLPGTSSYEEVKATPALFHFVFHQIRDLPETLIAGKEREYLKHFYDKLAYNSAGITPEDVDHYTLAFSLPGAMRCGLELYRSFEQDAEENRSWLKANGKLKLPSLVMMGANGELAKLADAMANEMHESTQVLEVEESGHWIAEENPEGFVKGILEFVKKH